MLFILLKPNARCAPVSSAVMVAWLTAARLEVRLGLILGFHVGLKSLVRGPGGLFSPQHKADMPFMGE